MKHQGQKDELLLEIANRLNLEYLSDLGYLKNPSIIQQAVIEIPADKYDIYEWNYAISYIHQTMHQKANIFHSVQEARNFLLNK